MLTVKTIENVRGEVIKVYFKETKPLDEEGSPSIPLQ